MNFNENDLLREKTELLYLRISKLARAKVLLKLEFDTQDQVLFYICSSTLILGATLLVTELIQHSIHTLKEPAYLLFLDAKSAFDRVLPELLIRELYLAGMDGNTTILVNNRLVNRHTYLDWNRTLMGPIKDELGLEQRGSNSCEFYKIYSNEILISAQKSRQGISLGGFLGTSQVISAIGLADDTALAANKLSNPSNILFLVQNYCKKYGVTLSHDKTKLMMFANKDKAGLKTKTFNPINIDGHVIDFTEQAEHVGVTRSTEGNMPHILNRMCAHRKALHGIGAAGVAKKARVNPLVALKLQQVYGCPVLMSGVASLALSGHEVSVLDKHLRDLPSYPETASKHTSGCCSLSWWEFAWHSCHSLANIVTIWYGSQTARRPDEYP